MSLMSAKKMKVADLSLLEPTLFVQIMLITDTRCTPLIKENKIRKVGKAGKGKPL